MPNTERDVTSWPDDWPNVEWEYVLVKRKRRCSRCKQDDQPLTEHVLVEQASGTITFGSYDHESKPVQARNMRVSEWLCSDCAKH
jgi:hypothetical protein